MPQWDNEDHSTLGEGEDPLLRTPGSGPPAWQRWRLVKIGRNGASNELPGFAVTAQFLPPVPAYDGPAHPTSVTQHGFIPNCSASAIAEQLGARTSRANPVVRQARPWRGERRILWRNGRGVAEPWLPATHAPGSIALPAWKTRESGGDFLKDFGVEFGQPDQRLCRAAGLPAPLLPLLQGPPGNSEQSRELRLRQSRFQPCANHG